MKKNPGRATLFDVFPKSHYASGRDRAALLHTKDADVEKKRPELFSWPLKEAEVRQWTVERIFYGSQGDTDRLPRTYIGR